MTKTPQAKQKPVTSPLSSCSNSPSSVRINQNYDPNNVKNHTTNEETNHTNDDGDADLENSEDADSMPLLNANENIHIALKRANNRCEKSDQVSTTTKADSDNESDTLIANSHT